MLPLKKILLETVLFVILALSIASLVLWSFLEIIDRQIVIVQFHRYFPLTNPALIVAPYSTANFYRINAVEKGDWESLKQQFDWLLMPYGDTYTQGQQQKLDCREINSEELDTMFHEGKSCTFLLSDIAKDQPCTSLRNYEYIHGRACFMLRLNVKIHLF
ncbi:hypothetical protein ACOME3_005705 [Neoechinorhynchus agilis]